MATNFISEVIDAMVKGKVNKCPVCGKEKDVDAWICKNCFVAKGHSLVKETQDAVNRAANKVPTEVWENLLKVARNLLSAPDKPKGVKDKDLVEALKPNLVGVPEGTIFAALDTARRIMEDEAEEAVRKANHEARWQVALAAVEEKFPGDEKIISVFFVKSPVRFNSGFISDNMMRAACTQVREERERAKKSQLAAAFVSNRLRKINFLGVEQQTTAAVPA